MGGKTSQSTQSVSIPPEVLARYNAVNTRAEQVAQQPFQQYPGQFVAPLTGTQQAGIQGTTSGANLAQPFFGAAAGMTMAGAQDVGALTPGQIAYYENPYIESVAQPTYQALRQQQQQEMAGQTAQAIRSGAFGGDRAGLVAANLARQQQLGTAQALAPIYAQGYGQAVQTAAGQQGVVAADLARRMQAGQQIAGLGAGAQQAALQGAQAQLAAGTAEQQTQQADLTARYNQFLQEQGYPFQVAQFLANIAMGTGALSGSTTTTTQPSSFFSDRRLKANVEEIGKLKDGQKLYRYTMADGRTHIGLMADEVEKHHPDAVGVAGGYKTVDYRAATDDAARHKKAYGGGLMPSSEGGAVTPGMAGEGYARGGQIDEIRRLLTMHREMVPYGHSGLYGNPDPRKGPYSTTMREINVPSRPLAPTTITIRPLNYAADIPAGVPQYAAGGVVGYAAGGLPYSEASEEYVPEDISKPMTPQSLKPAGGVSAQPVQDPTVRDLMQMGRMAASIYAGGMPFASGGVVPHMADGGSMDFDRIIAMQQGMYGQMGRPAGLNIPAMQPRDPVKSMELMKPSRAPEPVKTGLQELQEAAGRGEQTYKMASGAYGAGKTALLGKAATPASGSTPAQPAKPGLIGVGGEYRPESGIVANPRRVMEFLPDFGSGSQVPSSSSYPMPIPGMASGGVAGRRGYQTAGAVDDPYYDPAAIAAQDAIERANRDPAANRPFVSAPVSEADRAVTPAIHSGSANENFIQAILRRHEQARQEAVSRSQNAAESERILRESAPPPVASDSAAPSQPQTSGAVSPDDRAAIENAQRRAAIEMTRGSSSSIPQAIRRFLPSLYPMEPAADAGLEGSSSTDVQAGLDRAGRIERAIADQRRLNASRALSAARSSGNEEAVAAAQREYDEALENSRRVASATRATQNASQIPAQGPITPDSARPPSGTNLPPDGVTPPPLPAPIEVGPVTGQGKPDVNEEAPQPTGVVMEPPAQQAPAGVAAAQAQQPSTMSGGEGGRGLLGAVASENFLVPLLTGLGAMASSPSRYLGSAILQGVGAGAQAYENVQTKAAERARTQAETQRLQQQTAVGAFFESNGVPYVMVRDSNNMPMAIRRSVYNQNPNRYVLVPISSAKPVMPPQVSIPASQQSGAVVSPEIANLARQNATRAADVNPQQFANDPAANPFTAAEERAQQARLNTPQTFAFAESISSLPDYRRGPIASQFLSPIFQSLVPAIEGLGFRLPPDILSTQSAIEIINKMKAAMASATSEQTQQRAYQSIQNILNSIPTDYQSKEGAANLIASTIANDMIARDEAAFYDNYRRHIEDKYGLSPDQSKVSGYGLSEAFNNASRGRLAQDKADIMSLFNPLQARNASGQIVTVSPSILSYMVKNAGNYDPNFVAALNKQYGEDRARRLINYFSGARQ